MIKIIIVDDEYLIRERLKRCLSWADLGYEIVAEASNGDEALQVVNQLLPSVVIADIKMPRIDGIEFAKRMKQSHPEIKVVILTGYSDFNYAQEAIESGVVRYLLKPVDSDELRALFVELKSTIEQEMEMKNILGNLKKRSREKDQIEKEQFFSSLCNEHVQHYTEMELEKKLAIYCPRLNPDNLVVIGIRINNILQQWKRDRLLIRYAAKNIAEEILGMDKESYASTYDTNGNIIIITNLFSCENFGEKMRAAASFYLKVNLTISISGVRNSFAQISELYKQAIIAIQNRFLADQNKWIRYDELNHASTKTIIGSGLRQEMLVHLRVGNREFLTSFLEQQFAKLKQNRASFEALHYLLSEITLAAGDFALDNHSNLFDFSLKDVFLAELLEENETLDEIILLLLDRLNQLLIITKGSSQSSMEKIVERAKQYIDASCSNPGLSLTVIADSIYVNPSHLSHIFKKITGYSIVGYITELRIQSALQMMKDGQANLGQISEKVGFSDPYYFSKCFKKVYGVSPTEYLKSKGRTL